MKTKDIVLTDFLRGGDCAPIVSVGGVVASANMTAIAEMLTTSATVAIPSKKLHIRKFMSQKFC
jgi:hypothetical protein